MQLFATYAGLSCFIALCSTCFYMLLLKSCLFLKHLAVWVLVLKWWLECQDLLPQCLHTIFDSIDVSERVLSKSRRAGAAPLPNNSCLHHKVWHCQWQTIHNDCVNTVETLPCHRSYSEWNTQVESHTSLQCLSALYMLHSPINAGLGQAQRLIRIHIEEKISGHV